MCFGEFGWMQVLKEEMRIMNEINEMLESEMMNEIW